MKSLREGIRVLKKVIKVLYYTNGHTITCFSHPTFFSSLYGNYTHHFLQNKIYLLYKFKFIIYKLISYFLKLNNNIL